MPMQCCMGALHEQRKHNTPAHAATGMRSCCPHTHTQEIITAAAAILSLRHVIKKSWRGGSRVRKGRRVRKGHETVLHGHAQPPHLQRGRLPLQPEQRHELAEALLDVQAELAHITKAEPGVHELVRQDGARQQPRQPVQHQHRRHLRARAPNQAVQRTLAAGETAMQQSHAHVSPKQVSLANMRPGPAGNLAVAEPLQLADAGHHSRGQYTLEPAALAMLHLDAWSLCKWAGRGPPPRSGRAPRRASARARSRRRAPRGRRSACAQRS